MAAIADGNSDVFRSTDCDAIHGDLTPLIPTCEHCNSARIRLADQDFSQVITD
jgi:hypothetical protein